VTSVSGFTPMAVATARPLVRPSTVVAVGSGKGGVGTSTVAALLASTMAADGHHVLLVDAGHRLGALHHLLGVEPSVALSELRGGRREPKDLILSVTGQMSLIATGADDLATTERRVLMRRISSLFGSYALVVIDAGSTAESLVSACRNGVGRLLAVSAGDRVSLAATYAVVKLLHEQAPDVRVDLVANRLDQPAAERMHEYVNEASLRFLRRTVPFGGTIPDDPDFGRVLAAGLGSEQAALGSSAAAAARALGEHLLFDDVAIPGRPGAGPFLRLLRKG
jgi:flagellar biosynthesis protein FlhG